MVTTTSYGTWLPGDLRGYVQDGVILPPSPNLLAFAKAQLKSEPVVFTPIERDRLFRALCDACAEFGYQLHDASVESWHVHWVAHHGFEPVAGMVGRIKTRMRQALGRGRIWTEGFCHRCMYALEELPVASAYVAKHRGCRMTGGRIVTPR